jgi:hypothetical protein
MEREVKGEEGKEELEAQKTNTLRPSNTAPVNYNY